MLIENINETKDLRSGIVFEYQGVILKIVSGEKACSECYFNDSRKWSYNTMSWCQSKIW